MSFACTSVVDFSEKPLPPARERFSFDGIVAIELQKIESCECSVYSEQIGNSKAKKYSIFCAETSFQGRSWHSIFVSSDADQASAL
jgi:hypothetical protein